ncbi:LysR substrate-binding domain-containing protein [Roseateles chitinivorans]|uniref:LysR substrate-binding domain-containing protein n=1 Tax=Roseateles chitinivorans TaxID=2917965 RepID=UPI003D674C28
MRLLRHRRLAATPREGGDPVFVGFDEQNAHLPDALWLTQQFPKVRVAIRAGNHMLQRIAAREGAGLALLPHYVARAEPRLRLCVVGPTPPQRELWMVTRRDDGRNPAIRAVGDALVNAFDANQSLFQAPG